MLNSHSAEISDLKIRVSNCLNNSFIAHNARDNSGRVGEFRTAQCRCEIDEIDDLIGVIYGLNVAEITSVKNYDIHIRR